MNIAGRTTATTVRLLAASVVACSGLTVFAVPALAANRVTVTNPGAQTTNPLSAKVSLQIKAADSAKSALSYSATGLPAGLAIGKTTGVISGTITKASAGTVKVTVADATGATGAASFTWTARNTIVVSNPGTQVTTAGSPVSLAVPAADDDKATTLTWTASGLPAGLAIGAATGIITGEPSAGGTYVVTVKVTDKTASSASTSFTWKIGDLVTVSTPTSERSYAGVPVSVQVKTTDSDPAQKLSYAAAGLPAGLAINAASGVISGTPAKTGKSAVTVTATDGAGSSGTASIAWTVGTAITIAQMGAVPVTAGVALTVPIGYTDAVPHDSVTLSVHGLPQGLTFAAHPATIFGWVTRPGTYPVTVTAAGSLGDGQSMTFDLVVKPASGGGPTGQIRLDLGSRCLDDLANKAALWTCQPGSAQRWTLATDGTIRARGACLDIEGSVAYLGQGVRMWHCASGAARETWAVGTAGELVNPASGLCLGDARASIANGYRPTMIACRVTGSQVWLVPGAQLRSARAAKCADDLHSGGGNGNVIDMFGCNGTASQSWTVEPDFTVRMFGNKCLTDPGKLGVPGVKIALWSCANGDKGQKVIVVHRGGLGSWVTIDGVCVAIPSMTAADTSQLVTATCTPGDPRDLWDVW